MNEKVGGVLAALASPLAMTIGFIVWDKVWKGHPTVLNAIKCTIATVFFTVTFLSLEGYGWILEIQQMTVLMLLLSAFIGIIIGDTLWLEALKSIGSRRVIMIDILKPFCAAIFGWLVLEEGFHLLTIIGILITMVGVLIVSLEKAPSEPQDCAAKDDNIPNGDDFENKGQELSMVEDQMDERAPSISLGTPPGSACNEQEEINANHEQSTWTKGYIYAALNVIFDVYGSVLTKQHAKTLSTWDINTIRFGSAGALLSLIVFLANSSRFLRLYKGKSEARRNQLTLPLLNVRGWGKVLIGISLVTYLTPALSQYALFRVDLAVALTLGSIGPIYSLPLVWLMKGETISKRAVIGSIIGCLGIVPLSFNDYIML